MLNIRVADFRIIGQNHRANKEMSSIQLDYSLNSSISIRASEKLRHPHTDQHKHETIIDRCGFSERHYWSRTGYSLAGKRRATVV